MDELLKVGVIANTHGVRGELKVLLVPQYSEVTPNMIDLTTYLTKKIKLNIPMMSASMDTVTEHRMAILDLRKMGR